MLASEPVSLFDDVIRHRRSGRQLDWVLDTLWLTARPRCRALTNHQPQITVEDLSPALLDFLSHLHCRLRQARELSIGFPKRCIQLLTGCRGVGVLQRCFGQTTRLPFRNHAPSLTPHRRRDSLARRLAEVLGALDRDACLRQ